jgi:multiple sugar transport system permease protein
MNVGRRIMRSNLLIIMIILAILSVTVWIWIAYPIAYAFFHSFHAYDITRPWLIGEFVELRNYIDVITSYYFLRSLVVTALFIVISVPLTVFVALGLALLLNQEIHGAGIIQVIAILPWTIPLVVSGTMYKWMFDGNWGVVNYILTKLSVITEYQPWLTMPWATMIIICVAWIWTQYPLPMILFLARLKLMPSDIYEASIIDGAGTFSRFRYIVLTWLRPILLLNLIYQTIIALATFDLIYVISGGGPFDFTSTISFFTYREAFQFFDWGRALALSFILFIIGLAVVYLYMKVLPLVRYR